MTACRALTRALATTGLLLALAAAQPAHGQHVGASPIDTDDVSALRVAGFNIAITGALAVTRGVITGEIRNGSDVAKHALAGSFAGYGFYESKRLVGAGHEWQGVALAYGMSSFLRNVGEGRHPLGSLCLGPGPVDLCVRTGLQAGEPAGLRVEANALAVTSGVILMTMGMEARFRHGVLHYRSSNDLGTEGEFRRTGYTIGRTIVLSPYARDDTWRHELIHLIQTLQLSSVSPMFTFRTMLHTVRSVEHHVDAFPVRKWDVQVDWLLLTFGAANTLVPYERQWNEIEAYRLTQPRRDHGLMGGAMPAP